MWSKHENRPMKISDACMWRTAVCTNCSSNEHWFNVYKNISFLANCSMQTLIRDCSCFKRGRRWCTVYTRAKYKCHDDCKRHANNLDIGEVQRRRRFMIKRYNGDVDSQSRVTMATSIHNNVIDRRAELLFGSPRLNSSTTWCTMQVGMSVLWKEDIHERWC